MGSSVTTCWLCGGARPRCGCVAAELDELEEVEQRGRPTGGPDESWSHETTSHDHWLSTGSALRGRHGPSLRAPAEERGLAIGYPPPWGRGEAPWGLPPDSETELVPNRSARSLHSLGLAMEDCGRAAAEAADAFASVASALSDGFAPVDLIGGHADRQHVHLQPGQAFLQLGDQVYRIVSVGDERYGLAPGWSVESIAARAEVDRAHLQYARLAAGDILAHAQRQVFASMAALVRERGARWLGQPEVVYWDDPRTLQVVLAGSGWVAMPPEAGG